MSTTESVPAQTAATAYGISAHSLVTRKDLRLNRDPARVIAKLLASGTLPTGLSIRATHIVERALELDDAQVGAAYAGTKEDFSRRHRDLEAVFEEDFNAIRHRIPEGVDLDEKRRLLVGALFTHEVAIEAAALTNPSMVPHPDQSGLGAGETRFVMSARAMGEGHLSAVEFRTGVVTADGEITVDEPSPYAECGSVRSVTCDRSLLAAALDRPEDEVLAFVLRQLPEKFTEAAVDRVLRDVPVPLRGVEAADQTAADIRRVLACQYQRTFDAIDDISERVLWPMSPTERVGMEDARFVRFTDVDGATDYRATYTANHGSGFGVQMIRTADFRTFDISQLFGAGAADKGLALFPRPIAGRYAALSRFDGEHNAIAFSDDGVIWPDATMLPSSSHPWRLVKDGNCGCPIETEAGWLVLTHGVGPMRTYSLGAMLLDLHDPTRVIGSLDEPLLKASPDDRDGYVPNVVYSCGALICGDTLVIPYGFGDMGIEFATAPVPALLELLQR